MDSLGYRTEIFCPACVGDNSGSEPINYENGLSALVKDLSVEEPIAEKLMNSGKLGFSKSSWSGGC